MPKKGPQSLPVDIPPPSYNSLLCEQKVKVKVKQPKSKTFQFTQEEWDTIFRRERPLPPPRPVTPAKTAPTKQAVVDSKVCKTNPNLKVNNRNCDAQVLACEFFVGHERLPLVRQLKFEFIESVDLKYREGFITKVVPKPTPSKNKVEFTDLSGVVQIYTDSIVISIKDSVVSVSKNTSKDKFKVLGEDVCIAYDTTKFFTEKHSN